MNDNRGDRWDWTTVLAMIVAILVVLMLTFELWIGHPVSMDNPACLVSVVMRAASDEMKQNHEQHQDNEAKHRERPQRIASTGRAGGNAARSVSGFTRDPEGASAPGERHTATIRRQAQGLVYAQCCRDQQQHQRKNRVEQR